MFLACGRDPEATSEGFGIRAPLPRAASCYAQWTMLDLKAKLASAGLVSREDVERVERDKAKKKAKNKARRQRKTANDDIDRVVAALKDKPKGEVYETIRKWVDRARLDPSSNVPSGTAKAFHFAQSTGKVGRLYLEQDVVQKIERGEAGVVAFMSNHGLAHAVVPAADARGIGTVYPLWLRMLEGDDRAGTIEKPG